MQIYEYFLNYQLFLFNFFIFLLLFKLIIGQEELDSGSIYIPSDYKIGYLKQYIKFDADTILDEASYDMPLLEGGIKELHLAKAMLQGLGFEQSDFDKSPTILSGGLQVRLQLARLLCNCS